VHINSVPTNQRTKTGSNTKKIDKDCKELLLLLFVRITKEA